jgi:general secretion pathway protein M
MSRLKQRFDSSAVGAWYSGREPGEQRIIAALSAVVAFVVLWLGIWQPISDWRAQEHNRYQNAQAQLDWMRANESRARALGAGGAASGQRSLLPIITRAAQAQGIQVNRVQPESGGAVSVAIQGQPFNDVLQWLHQLEENNGVTVLRLASDAQSQPGIVNAQVRLQ